MYYEAAMYGPMTTNISPQTGSCSTTHVKDRKREGVIKLAGTGLTERQDIRLHRLMQYRLHEGQQRAGKDWWTSQQAPG